MPATSAPQAASSFHQRRANRDGSAWTEMKESFRAVPRWIRLVFAASLLIVQVACGGVGAQPSPAVAAKPTPSSASASPAAKFEQAQLYFSAGGKLVTETASVNSVNAPQAAMQALLAGPKTTGHFSEIPKGAQLLDFQVKGDVAYVSMSKEFFASGGSTGMQLRLAQVVYTATQFPGVKSVQFLQEGQIIPAAGGEGFPVGKPLTRQNFPGLA